MSNPACESCIFWRRFPAEQIGEREQHFITDGSPAVGHCRRLPPVPDAAGFELRARLRRDTNSAGQDYEQVTGALAASLHPTTTATQWCGEYRQTPAHGKSDPAAGVNRMQPRTLPGAAAPAQ